MTDVSAQVALRSAPAPDELAELLREYVVAACAPGEARDRLDGWAPLRAAARRHWEELLEAERFGRDVSEAATWKLIAHADGAIAQRHDAFVHPLAPAVARDLHLWFETAGWVRREQWPELGRGLFDLVRRCTDHPNELWPAIEAFLAVPGASAFTAEMIAPILHALRPTEFVLLDAACRTLLNHATGSAYANSLRDFPAAHAAARRLLAELRPALAASALCDRRPEDVLDGFCHWVVHVRLMRRDEEPGASETAEAVATPPVEPRAAETGSPSSESCAEIVRDLAPDASADARDSLIAANASEPDVQNDVGNDAPADEHDALAADVAAAPLLDVHDDVACDASPASIAGETSEAPPIVIEEAPAVVDAAVAPQQPAEPTPPAMAGPSSPAPVPATRFDAARAALERRGQLVLAGPPGSGKSHLARRLAEELVAGSDGFLEHLVLHQAWRYADFVQGAAPDGSRRPGLFANFCRQAAARRGPCVLIVDNAERVDPAEVCGEALALLEHRGLQVALPGGGVLAVPPNVRVVFTLDDGSRAGRAALSELLRTCAVLRVDDEDELRRHHPGAAFVEPLLELRRAAAAQIGDPARGLPLAFFLRARLPEELEAVWRAEVEPFLALALPDEPVRAAAFRWDAIAARFR